MKKIFSFLIGLLLLVPAVKAQEIHRGGAVTTLRDIERAEAILGGMDHVIGPQALSECTTCTILDAGIPTSELMVYAARYLLGTPYVASTLEGGTKEELRVYLTKTDCILFVETCLNLALTKMQGHSDFDALAENLRQSRYRGGVVSCYADRIHYTTEWIRLKEKKGILKDITLDLGGIKTEKKIFYMSRNYKSYKHLKDADTDPAAARNRDIIAGVEEELNQSPQTYIPAARIREIEGQIRSGDIICYMSGVEGLDIAHVAIAYVHDGKVGFIHASQADGKVEIDPLTIADYVKSRKNCPGIKVVRVL